MNKSIGFLALVLAQNLAFADIASSIQPKVNKDASKIDVVKGIWVINYRTNGTDKTENLAIEDTTTLSNGDIAGGGYLHSALVPSVYLPASCLYNAFPNLGTDYVCGVASADGKSIAFFAFSFSGNKIVNGYYGIGTDSTTAAFSLNSKNTVITGNRIDNNDVFDINSGLLTLPSVQVGPTKYSATLKLQNNVFTLQSANPK